MAQTHTAALADITYMENYAQEVKLSRAEVVEALNSLKLETVAGNANFILVKLSDDLRQAIFSSFKEHNIYVRDFSNSEQLKGFIRISIGTRSQMKVVLEIFNRAHFRLTRKR